MTVLLFCRNFQMHSKVCLGSPEPGASILFVGSPSRRAQPFQSFTQNLLQDTAALLFKGQLTEIVNLAFSKLIYKILKCGPDPLTTGMNQVPPDGQSWWPEGRTIANNGTFLVEAL
jgi:hypothetical protein